MMLVVFFDIPHCGDEVLLLYRIYHHAPSTGISVLVYIYSDCLMYKYPARASKFVQQRLNGVRQSR